MFSCPSYVTDHDTWKIWFVHGIDEGKNVLQSILRKTQDEQGTGIGNLSAQQVTYLHTRCPPPDNWPKQDDSWMLLPDLVEAAKEAARVIFGKEYGCFRRGEPNPDLSRERRLSYLTSQNNFPIHLFSMAKVHISSGKARLRIVIDGQQRSEQNGIYISTQLKGLNFIDYDPNIEQNGLVVKRPDNSVFGPRGSSTPFVYWDWQLVWHSKNSYYLGFVRTLDQHNRQVRAEL